jgi:hypothetical protein
MKGNNMPKQIKLVIVAIAASFLVGGIDLILQSFGVTHQTSEFGTAPAFVGGILLTGILLFFIAKRHNWARWVFIVLTLIGMPFIIPIFIEELQTDIIGAISTSIQTALQIWAVALLFRKPVRLWFGKAEQMANKPSEAIQ